MMSSDPSALKPSKRARTQRSISSTLSADPKSRADISSRTQEMNQRAKDGAPLSETELRDVINSVQNVYPSETDMSWEDLRTVLKDVAHLSHKDWAVTGNNAKRLGEKLLQDGVSKSSRQLLERILTEGKWDEGAKHATERPDSVQPWAVLVTGVNGIRKTTSIYQTWFPNLLGEALVAPDGAKTDFSNQVLPVGSNSFFRQLDHMIATLCNEDFGLLYSMTSELLDEQMLKDPPRDVIKKYSDLKAAIFTRYRTLAELLGALLLTEAQLVKSNCMMETSGRDVAMFNYVDHFFPKGYSKLALHFTVNDLSQAKESVDQRMVREIQTGINAVKKESVFDIINANAGGPYGSEVLEGIQRDSDKVWNTVLDGSAGVGKDWYKATIRINAKANEPWTAQAVKPDGSLGAEFVFEKSPSF
ncbi:predicted protein [Phaeodactylum tricornutum CCAP 1055/1]|uniref:Uncharacterized protein n=1 Tax=Phaeodactylum tricornutum (strain CCAP 1055/1) TaxID=556484 RepID=B7GBL7_PHATC|nr:predicted protein [Phaeodactylum tricornutum CCAP 1055/1]EEC43947.1 predicted protein [Phaeodactylum tricornutum CCAP 1055/1]|eukprot:XP_002184548.1 predicted protein [Phaeodactylum tricornutum CCAP 1055/1]